MERRTLEYIARRMEEGAEGRRRRREDGTFMEGERYEGQGEPNERREVRGEIESRRYENEGRVTNHGPDNEERRRIGFTSDKGESKSKSHWNEEEFVGDMEESLYHEVDDIFHYLKIMEKVYKKGYDELASAFYEIACEKFVCAEFLKHQLKKTGHYDASEHKELEHDLEKAKKMFSRI